MFCSKKDIKDLLKRHNIQPSKGLGQNFLIDKTVFKKIIKAANLSKKDTVLEIGSGIGNLTYLLSQNAKRVIAVEKDKRMIKALRESLKFCNAKNVEIIEKDILNFQFPSSKSQIPKTYKIIANLPYYIVSPVIRKFLESEYPPKSMVLVIQKEVAQRICASPPHISILAVSVQFFAKPKIISYISKKSFWPSPKVDSAIIKISVRDPVSYGFDKKLFFRIVKAGFSQPRKQLANNLKKMLKLNKAEIESWLKKNKIKPTQRAETLTVQDWINLANSEKLRTKSEKP